MAWETIEIGGESLGINGEGSPSGNHKVGHRPSIEGAEGIVVLLDGESPIWHHRLSEPRSAGVSRNGRVVGADWIEYGESTGARIIVFDQDGQKLYDEQRDISSPLVDISADGSKIAVCPYNEMCRVFDLDRREIVMLHEYKLEDRLVPSWQAVEGHPRIGFRQNSNSEKLYEIDLQENIVWEGESFQDRLYYYTLSLDDSTPWSEIVVKITEDYSQSNNDGLKNTMAESVGETRLVDANERVLREVISGLSECKTAFSENDAHVKLAATKLGEAHYRLAKKIQSGQRASSGYWKLLEKAAAEYKHVLPWYDGKVGLSKTLRQQANQLASEGRRAEALDATERIEMLHTYFDVQLLSTGDENRLESCRDEGLNAVTPSETGRMITKSELRDYE
jgi:hypothetical protein